MLLMKKNKEENRNRKNRNGKKNIEDRKNPNSFNGYIHRWAK